MTWIPAVAAVTAAAAAWVAIFLGGRYRREDKIEQRLKDIYDTLSNHLVEHVKEQQEWTKRIEQDMQETKLELRGIRAILTAVYPEIAKAFNIEG